MSLYTVFVVLAILLLEELTYRVAQDFQLAEQELEK